jgi:glycosyltransferase involved in cell wall biosynthesis
VSKFTIVIPTYNHGSTIKYAIDSILSQNEQDFEIFIIGDGVPEPVKPLINAIVQTDPRLRFFDYSKHSRRGEPNRHVALQQATGEIICYMTDRDIWLPNHLTNIQALLIDADFAHTLPLHILPGGKIKAFPCDLSLSECRQFILNSLNLIPFSCAAHTRSFYQSLPQGWSTTPRKIATDWYMFKKFLAIKNCRAVSGFYPSAITFPSPIRKGWTEAQRIEELEEWKIKLGEPNMQALLMQRVLQSTVQRAYARGWLVRNLLLKLPGLSAIGQYFPKIKPK